MPTLARTRSAVVAVTALVCLAGCSGDEPAETAADVTTEDATADDTEEVEDVADEARWGTS